MLDKTYDAASVENKIVARWEKENAFAAGAGKRDNGDPFCIVIPPPNVTGSLHMGHALNNTIQDILVRFERMRGKDVLWQPGMDHAGIATQMVVERQLMENQEPDRHALGREKFVERIWKWKNESGGLIFNQLKRLGASCDWSRERFTMDEGLSEAVLQVFVRLYKEGLIYKDKRLVNWDPKLLTAISDVEVEPIEVKGHLWHFRYPLADGASYQHPYKLDEEGNHAPWRPSDGEPDGYETRDYLVIATTRPETMLGDSGVAVHPEDPRYKSLIGKTIVLPLVGRRIPIVADFYPDPEAGTGAVKMTPAHDFNDFEVGKRCNLAAINILDVDASVLLKDNHDFLSGLQNGPELGALIEELHGQDRFFVREKLVEKMDQIGLLEKVEDHPHKVPHGDRGGVPIEPYLTEQWYVDAGKMAKPAIASVREGRTEFVPKNWEKTYFDWMENIQPWCISRQLWWGHQIPAWYGPDGTIFVEKSEGEAQDAARLHYGKAVELSRDSDVLDTWFSSALWPFSTLGWPQNSEELAKYYPTSVLVTGFDIIFFWVARMMMMGMHLMEEEPFPTVYVHALVRDKHGAKMSKSKGNVVNPLELIDEYGADALRFTMAILAAPGQDVKLDPARISSYRNFGTKLWNATRFAQMNGVTFGHEFNPHDAKLDLNRWILSELTKVSHDVTKAIESFRFNDAAATLYRFVWNQVCDWYLELLKPIFNGEDEAAIQEARECTAFVLAQAYKLLHPFMPFMSEELWEQCGVDDGLICHAVWPELDFIDDSAADGINWLISVVTGIRSTRAEMNVPAGARAPIIVVGANGLSRERFHLHEAALSRLARVDGLSFADEAPKGSAQVICGEAIVCLPLGELIDLDAEQKRLEKGLGKAIDERDKINKKLNNEKFVANARADVVESERAKLLDIAQTIEKLEAALVRLR